jgi:transposase
MVMSISLDLRERVVSAYATGEYTYAELAEHFDVGQASVSRWLRLNREQGTPARRPHGGGRAFLVDEANSKVLEAMVLAHPDWTEEEYRKAFNERTGLSLSDSTIGRAIRRLGYGVKKKRLLLAKETEQMLSAGGPPTQKKSETSPLRVWFLWTKRASTPR